MRILANLTLAAVVGSTSLAVQTESATAANPPEVRAKVGEMAPEFELTAFDGKEYSLANLKGKYIVLEWFNNKCPFVQKHYESGNMQKLQKEYAAKDVVWLTILSSAEGKQGYLTKEQAEKVRSDWNMEPTAMLADSSGNVGRLYGARTTPHMYVINSEGRLIYAGAIDSKNTTDADDIPSSANYVAAALDEAMEGKTVTTASTEPYGCSVKYAS